MATPPLDTLVAGAVTQLAIMERALHGRGEWRISWSGHCRIVTPRPTVDGIVFEVEFLAVMDEGWCVLYHDGIALSSQLFTCEEDVGTVMLSWAFKLNLATQRV